MFFACHTICHGPRENAPSNELPTYPQSLLGEIENWKTYGWNIRSDDAILFALIHQPTHRFDIPLLVTMKSALLVSVIISLVQALSAIDDATRFCASGTSPLFSNDAFCRPGNLDQVLHVEQPTSNSSSHATVVPEGSSNNETGWVGPRHCVREYCVYSNRQFASGLVVITDEKNAKQIANLPDSTAEQPTNEPPSFYATEIPGKGTGLVANRTIKRGERIMLWQPTFMIHRKLTDALDPEEQQYILDAALMRLPAPRRRAFLGQLGQFGGHRVSDILLTNAFQMDVGATSPSDQEGHHLGNFPDVSRFNHDCRPNVAFRIDAQLAHHTHAVRDIAAGEELTLAYMSPFETHAVRQEHILSSWGFKCTCPHCSMAADQVKESDARLWEIDQIEAELGNVVSKKATPKLVRRLLELYERERLDVKIHGAYVLAALNYNLFGDAKNAKKYADLAVEAGIVEFGPEADDVQSMRDLAKNPRAHFTWRKRIGG